MIELAAILVAFGIGFVIGRIGARELIAMLRRRDEDVEAEYETRRET